MLRSPREILEELKGLDFTGRGEAFVEARFLTPLLEALGYENHRDYEVLRHGDSGSSFKLRYPPVEGGAKPVRHYNPDFIPTIRKKMFWIVEAKTAIREGYPFKGHHIVQGLQYCIHPEIQAKYLLLTNGRHSAIYDAHSTVFFGRDVYDPILEFEVKDIASIWNRLHEILSVEKLRGGIEADLKAMYDRLCLSSLDKTYPQRMLHQIGSSQGENMRAIETNVRRLYLDGVNKQTEEWRKELDSMPSAQLNELMNLPVGVPPNVGTSYYYNQLKEGCSQRVIADSFLVDFDRQSIFRKEQAVLGLCQLYRNPDIEPALKEELLVFFNSIVSRDLPILSQVECALLRVVRKTLIAKMYPSFREHIASNLTTAPEIIRFALPPTAFMSTVGIELANHRTAFAQFQNLSEETLMRGLPVILKIEENLEPEFKKVKDALPDSEKQIGGLETYGIGGKHWRLRGMLEEYAIIAPRPSSAINQTQASNPACYEGQHREACRFKGGPEEGRQKDG